MSEMLTRIAFVLTMTLAVATGCSHNHGRVNRAVDPPLIVPWTRVGDIALAEPKERVESEYGREGHGYHVLDGGQSIMQGYYRRHGGQIYVEFEDGRVNEIQFGTRYYRTKHGFGVGSRIPFGRCHRTSQTACEHRWHGFVWNGWWKEKPCECWVKVGKGRRSLPATVANFEKPWTAIFARRGRVTGFLFAWKFVD